MSERARCPVCQNWVRFGTVDGLTVQYCGTCRTETLVPRREAPKIPRLHEKPRPIVMPPPKPSKGRQFGATDKTPRGPVYRIQF